ncbi:TetR/AcrR family transcriptional regulator [Camelimonas abortus]|uniref:TetR/AcrR family transcriptional regulator n=1 Tax=Camelimonas abortus TaxID=1017184 RepID=A0ABV7LEA7_9HYPH
MQDWGLDIEGRLSAACARTPTGRALTGRGRNTRLRLLQAVVDCLNSLGYAATTTQAVAELAGASRGSLLHQFPTRVHMMAAAADHAMALMIADSRARFGQIGSPVERLRQFCHVIEATQRQPAAQALNEILLASRWEEGLAGPLRKVTENVERIMDADIRRMALEAGVTSPDALRVRTRAIIAAMRGFAIELLFNADRAVTHQAIAVIRADYDRFLNGILPRVEQEGGPASHSPASG